MLISWFLALSILGCQTSNAKRETSSEKFKTIDYVEVGKVFPTIKSPYVIDVKNGNKRIVFIGCNHIKDTTDSQFDVIGKYFTDFRPQIAFNEGGQQSENVRYKSRNEAILKKGETGCLKYYSDKSRIPLLNGDTEDNVEFSITLNKYPKDKLFLYYIMERLVIPYLQGAYGNTPFEQMYPNVIDKWFVSNGYPLSKKEQDISYFQELYQKHMGTPFVLELNDNIEKFDYINGGDCEFCAIGRTSKMVRDSILLTKIDKALSKYDRVIVTFGHGHALAVEPALMQIINKER
jgi:hypothetical protein